ncbi:MarR family winged helix-turn-helix transcriptional regulator [Amycolatopsis japonica]|uniref:MarR family winged helix-turn-helix transcriptional regulator n=1 Tax=Amycolatopsis japonica TaxID=208439 RepID=UPI0036703E46
MHDSRTGNLLGAAALAVTDLTLADTTGTAGLSASGAAALVALATAPTISVTDLGRRVGLSQSAAARMVDSLQAAGLVERRPGAGREVAVQLTPRGRRTARDMLASRTKVLTDVLDVLNDRERETLAALLAKVLPRLYERIGSADLLCRLCDRRSCTTDATCPVGQAERDDRL